MGNVELLPYMSLKDKGASGSWNGLINWINLDEVVPEWKSDENKEVKYWTEQQFAPDKLILRAEIYSRKKLEEQPCPGMQHAYVILTCIENTYFLIEKTTDGIEINLSKSINMVQNSRGKLRKVRGLGKLCADCDAKDKLTIGKVADMVDSFRMQVYNSKTDNSLKFARLLFNSCADVPFTEDYKF